MAKELANLSWVEELLPVDHLRKRMFGGFAYYVEEKLILVMFESEGNTVYRGQRYPFEIWNGCMFPVEKEMQNQVLQQFPVLVSHPVLAKWLYIPLETEDFEFHVQSILREIRRRNPLFGTVPKAKGKALSSKSKEKAKDQIGSFVPRKPQMFRDEDEDRTLETAKKISDLKNLGPESEKIFAKAGIKSAPQAIKMGWKNVMEKLCQSNPKNNHSMFAYAVIGALKNQVWHLIPEEDKKAARDFMKSLRQKVLQKSAAKKPGESKKTTVQKPQRKKSSRALKRKTSKKFR